MECINRGFCEINSNFSLPSNYPENDFRKLTDNYAEDQNQNIAQIFGREDLIETYLESVTVQNNKLVLLRGYKALLRQDHGSLVDSVKLLSGGAATADPLYSGSIGSGMLTGAVFGGFKKSPPSLTILEVIRVMSQKNKQGVLVIVSNNLANRLNFGSACQSAAREGIKTLLVNVGEDVSGVSVSKAIGRKGLCGIKFLYKIAGAMSEDKKTLYEIFQVIEKLKGNSLGSINVQIRSDMMVIGPGCKGESEKLFFLWDTFDDIGENARLAFIVRQSLSHIFHPSSYFSLHVVKGDEIAVIVNNLGNLSDFYLSLTIKEILDQINTLGFKVMRIYSGRFLNSNLAGFSISVLKVKDNILELLDRPVNVTSWPEKSSVMTAAPNIILDLPSVRYTSTLGDKKNVGPKFTKQEATYLLDVLPKVVETIENMEEYLNKLDNDHDFGTTIKKFANALKTEIQNRSLKISTPYELLDQLAFLAGFTMGGVAGGIFSILFSSAAQVFLAVPSVSSISMGMWVEAVRAARDSLQRFTRVQPGDGTILDALDPFVESQTENSVKGLSMRVSAAVRGAENTRTSIGRVSVSHTTEGTIERGAKERGAKEGGARTPDPGALCLACVIRTIFTCVQIELAEAEAAARAEAEAAAAAAAAVSAGGKKGETQEVKETKLISTLREESKRRTEIEARVSKHGAELKVTESLHNIEIEESVSTNVKEVKGKETKLVGVLREESKDSNELKENDSKNHQEKEDAKQIKENQSQNSRPLKDSEHSEQFQQLKDAFEDIAEEIENEVPDENN